MTLAVERIKQQTCPVLNWDNRQCVKIHTLSATLQNSRCLSSPQGRFSEWEWDLQTGSPQTLRRGEGGQLKSGKMAGRPRKQQRVSFGSHVEQRTDALKPGCMLPCKSCSQVVQATPCCEERREGEETESKQTPRTAVTSTRASNWLSVGTELLQSKIAI